MVTSLVQNLALQPPGTISGRVYDSNGVPRSDVLIEVWGSAEDMLPLIEPVYSGSGLSFSFCFCRKRLLCVCH